MTLGGSGETNREHPSIAVITSGMAVLPDEAKLLVGEIQKVNSFTLISKVMITESSEIFICYIINIKSKHL